MTSLTKDQIKKLTPEQQETIGILEAQRIRRRLELLGQAQRYRGFYLVPTVLFVTAGAIGVFDASKTRLLPFCIIGLACLIQFHAAGLNQRLNALMELLDPDIKKASEIEERRDNRAG